MDINLWEQRGEIWKAEDGTQLIGLLKENNGQFLVQSLLFIAEENHDLDSEVTGLGDIQVCI